jgi:HPt (histidine-containing phosphotransfer) domain-containing protein
MLPSAPEFVEMMGGLPELALEVVQTAQREVTEQIPRAESLMETKDVVGLGKLLHSIRGSSSTLGATALAAYLREVENTLPDSPTSDWNFPSAELSAWFTSYLSSLATLEIELRQLPQAG